MTISNTSGDLYQQIYKKLLLVVPDLLATKLSIPQHEASRMNRSIGGVKSL